MTFSMRAKSRVTEVGCLPFFKGRTKPMFSLSSKTALTPGKSYALVIDTEYESSYDIKSLLAGEMNAYYKQHCSTMFCGRNKDALSPELNVVVNKAKQHRGVGMATDGMYLLSLKHSRKEAIELIKKGRFHETIIDSLPFEEYYLKQEKLPGNPLSVITF